MYSDLNWNDIETDLWLPQVVAMNTINCNGFAGASKIPSFENISESFIVDVCVHKLLTKRLNYTWWKPKTPNSIIHGQAYST